MDEVKVRVLLDVDGVLNAVCHEDDLTDEWDDWKTAECMGFRIRHSPKMGAVIGVWSRLPGVEVCWLTTWEHKANEWITPLFNDWPQFRVIERHDIERADGSATGQLWASRGPWWKLVEAQALWAEDQVPFVWIDDDLGSAFGDDGATEWVESLGDKALIINPYTHEALTQDLVNRASHFIERWRNAPVSAG